MPRLSKLLFLAIILVTGYTISVQAQGPVQRQQLFDYDWKFFLGDEAKANTIDFDDKSW
jgi:beta-galactosidase